MAKELPYFKFEPAEYLTKNISFCSLSAQGLFINICSYYWQRNCRLTIDQVLKRLNYREEVDELISEGIIDLNGEFITIKFLDNQLFDVEKTSKQNSANGAKGGRPKKPTESENKPTALIPLSETKGIREDEIKEDEIKEEEEELPLPLDNDFDLFWNKYNKKIDSTKCKAKFNKLSKIKIETILKVVDSYVAATSDVQYRKNPLTWLNGECWKDVEVNTFLPTKDKPFGKSNQL
jgi:hypothetical protein